MASSVLGSLKLVNAVRENSLDVVLIRRQKMTTKIKEQIEMAKCFKNGTKYEVKRVRKERDELSGELMTIESSKRLRQMWFTNAESGKICIQLRYSSKVIDLAKGKNSVEVASASELVSALEALLKATEVGELDTQLASASDAIKERFSKS
jgi:predicted nicotinamide N-methyase